MTIRVTTLRPSSSTSRLYLPFRPAMDMLRVSAVLSSARRQTAARSALTVSALSVYSDFTLLISFTAWEDVTIVLDVADPNYTNTLGKGDGVTGDMVTEDDGKTWTVAKIEIPEYTF